MHIERILPGGGLAVELAPDDCYTLAAACHLAGNYQSEMARGQDQDLLVGHVYDIFAALFEGYALAGAAPCNMRQSEQAGYTVESIREAWEVIAKGGAR